MNCFLPSIRFLLCSPLCTSRCFQVLLWLQKKTWIYFNVILNALLLWIMFICKALPEIKVNKYSKAWMSTAYYVQCWFWKTTVQTKTSINYIQTCKRTVFLGTCVCLWLCIHSIVRKFASTMKIKRTYPDSSFSC